MLEIFLETPKWVFVSFALILFLGISTCFESRRSAQELILSPLIFLGLSLYFLVLRSSSPLISAMTFLASTIAGTGLASFVYRNTYIGIDPKTDKIICKGEYKLFVIILIVFMVKYFLGYQQAINPTSSENILFTIADVGISGLLIGFFLGRCGMFIRQARRAVNSSQ